MAVVVEYADDAKPLQIDNRFWVHESSQSLFPSSERTSVKYRLVAISCEDNNGKTHLPLIFRVHSKKSVLKALKSWRKNKRKLYFEQFPAKTIWSASSDYEPRPSLRTARVLVSIEGLSFMQSVPCHCTLVGNSLSYIQLENPETPNWCNFSLSHKTDVSFNGQTITVTLHNGVPITLVLEFAKVLANPQATASAWHLALQQSIELSRHGFDNEESRVDDVYVRYGTHACRRSLSLKRGVLQIGSQETRFGLTPQCMLRNGRNPASLEIVFHRSHEPFYHKQEQQNAKINSLKIRFSNAALARLWAEKLSAALQRCEDVFRRPHAVGKIGLFIPPAAFSSSLVGSDLSPPVSTLLNRFSYPKDMTQPLIWRGNELNQAENSPGVEVTAFCLLDPDAPALEHTPPEAVPAHEIRCESDLATNLEKWNNGITFVAFAGSPSINEHGIDNASETESEPEPEPNAPEVLLTDANAMDQVMTEITTVATLWNEGWLNVRGEVELTRHVSVNGNRILLRKFVDGPALSTYELSADSVITCDAQNSVIQVSKLAELSDDDERTDLPEPLVFVCVSDGTLGKDPQADARRWEMVLNRAVGQMSWPDTPEGEKPRATSITVGSFVQFSMKRDRFHMWMSNAVAKPLKNGRDVVAILADKEMYGEGEADVVLSVEVKGQPQEAQTYNITSDTKVHIKDEYLVIMDLQPEGDADTEITSPYTWNHFIILKTIVGAKRKNSASYQENINATWRELLESATSGTRSFMPTTEVVSQVLVATPVSSADEDPFLESRTELARIAAFALPSPQYASFCEVNEAEKAELDAFAGAVVTYLQRRRLQAFLLRHRNSILHEADPAKILQSFLQREEGKIAEDPTALLYQSLDALVQEDQSASSKTGGNAIQQIKAARRAAFIYKVVQRAFDEVDKNLVFRNSRSGKEVDVVQLTVDMLLELYWQQDDALSNLKLREVKCLPTFLWTSESRVNREGWMMVKEWFGMDLGEHGQTLRFCRIKDHSFFCGADEKDVPETDGKPWRAQLSENDLVEAHGRNLRLVLNPAGMSLVIELSCASEAIAALWEQSFKLTFGTPMDVLVSGNLIVDAEEPSSWRTARPMMCKINNEELVVHDTRTTGSFPHQILLHADTIPGDPLAILVVTQAPKHGGDMGGYSDDEEDISLKLGELSTPVALRLRAQSKDVVDLWLEVFYKIVAVKGSRLNKSSVRTTVNKQLIYFKTHPGSAALPGLTPQGPCLDDVAISGDIHDLADGDDDHDDAGADAITNETVDREASFMGGFLNIPGAAVEAGALTDAKLWKKVRKAKGRKVLREIWMSGCTLDTARLGELCTQLAEAELWRRVMRLDLTGTNLDDTGASVISKAFTPDSNGEANMQLMYLHLNNNCIGDLGATHIAKLVCQVPTLASLSLSRNRLRDAGVGAIFQAMLCEEDAGADQIDATAAPDSDDDASTDSVAAALALLTGASTSSVRGLTALDLSHNSMTTAGAAVLASVLVDPKSRNAMRILDLSKNRIANFGAASLVSAATKSNVQMLNLAQNDIGDAGAKRIAALLDTYSSGTSLSNLNLSGNKITDDTLQDLDVVFQNSSVTVIM